MVNGSECHWTHGGRCLLLVVLLTVVSGCGVTTDRGESTYANWREPVTVATGGTTVGPWRMNRSDWEYVDNPVVDLTERGNAGVAWVDQGRKDVFFQFYDSDGSPRFDGPVNVSGTPGIFSWYPDVVVEGETEPAAVHVLWQEIVFSGGSHGGEIFYARSTDGGRSFAEPVNLSNSEEGDGKGRLDRDTWDNGSLDLTAGPGGSLYAVWTEYEGTLWLSRSHDRGATFSDPVRIAGSEDRPARAPSVDVGPEGHPVVAWTVGEETGANVHVGTLTPDGDTARAPRLVHESSGHSDAPKLAVDDDGTRHVVYAESPEGPGGPYHVRYVRARGKDEEFGEPRVLKASSTDGVESYHYPSLNLDEAGNPYVVWELFPAEESRRSRGLGLIASEDGGRTFGAPEVVPGTLEGGSGFNGGLQGKLTNKIDVADGRVAVAHSTFDPGEGSRVLLYLGSRKSR